MKKLLSLICSLAFVFALVACDSKPASEENNETAEAIEEVEVIADEEAVNEDAEAEGTEAEAEEGTEEEASEEAEESAE